MIPYTLRRSAHRRTLAVRITRDGKVIAYAPLGAPLTHIEKFLTEHERWITEKVREAEIRTEKRPPLTPARIAELKAEAYAYLPARLAYYESLMGLKAAGMRVTTAKTRFGSCSPKNSLSFSCLLMQYPKEAVDYVIVHELAHIREKNHGSRFYQLVSAYMPDYKKRAKMLKE